jgi:2,5-diketo-D-gluconate reductase A
MHLFLQQPELRDICESYGIVIQAYGHHRDELRSEPLLANAATALGAPSVGVMSMRWVLQVGAAIIPRSRKREYIRENQRVFDVVLQPSAVAALAAANLNTSLYGLHQAFVEDSIR